MGSPKYKVNLNFWKEISSECQAYLFGLLCSDGGVVYYRGYPRYWYIASSDKEIVELAREFVDYSGPLRVRGSVYPRKQLYFLTVSRSSMVRDLAALGVIHNKNRMGWLGDKIPKGLLRHFCRGLVDGDGCISLRKNVRSNTLSLWYVDGSRQFVEGMSHQWETVLGEPVEVKRGSGRSWRVAIHGLKADAILRWMYSGVTVSLKRKQAIVEKALSMRWRTKSEAATAREAERRRFPTTNHKAELEWIRECSQA